MAHQSTELECPRCGHLLGALADDSERRGEPGGNCSECGLAVEWSALRESSNDPRWFVESRTVRSQPRRRILRALSTLAMSARAFRFWSRVSMAIPTDRRGIATFLVMVALIAHLLLAARNIHTLATKGGGWKIGPGGAMITRTTSHPLDYLGALLVPLSSVSVTEASDEVRLVASMNRETNGMVEHIARVAIVLLEEPGLWPPAWLPGREKNPDIPRYQTPLRIANERMLDSTGIGRLLCVMYVPLLAPLAILLLPASMRRARIRSRHLGRCAVYSTVLLIPIMALYFLSPDGFGVRLGADAGLLLPHALLACMIPPTFLWNLAFARNYLRLEHPTAVAASNTVLAALFSLAVRSMMLGWI